MLLVIDNYDSFTYNLVQYLAELGAKVRVERNDAITLERVEALEPKGILLSPGPGRPENAGITLGVVDRFAGRIPLLGVCLGHQAIAMSYGATIKRADRLMHGRTSEILHDGTGLFQGLPSPFVATRYHSLIVDKSTLSDELVPTAWTQEGELMALAHRTLPIFGVQFHPESFLTEHGMALLSTFYGLVRQPSMNPARQ